MCGFITKKDRRRLVGNAREFQLDYKGDQRLMCVWYMFALE